MTTEDCTFLKDEDNPNADGCKGCEFNLNPTRDIGICQLNRDDPNYYDCTYKEGIWIKRDSHDIIANEVINTKRFINDLEV